MAAAAAAVIVLLIGIEVLLLAYTRLFLDIIYAVLSTFLFCSVACSVAVSVCGAESKTPLKGRVGTLVIRP